MRKVSKSLWSCVKAGGGAGMLAAAALPRLCTLFGTFSVKYVEGSLPCVKAMAVSRGWAEVEGLPRVEAVAVSRGGAEVEGLPVVACCLGLTPAPSTTVHSET